MGYGLRTYDAAGDVLVDADARLNRHRYATEVNKDTSGNVSLPDIDGQLTIEISLLKNVLDYASPWFMCSHQISRSGTTIAWTASAYSDLRCDSLILVFFYV